MKYEEPIMEVLYLNMNQNVIVTSPGEYVEGETNLGEDGVVQAPTGGF